jgi:hypothetical protein
MPTADRYLQFRGKVQERLNWQHWKCCEPQKGSVGSNPTLSAIFDWSKDACHHEPSEPHGFACVASIYYPSIWLQAPHKV